MKNWAFSYLFTLFQIGHSCEKRSETGINTVIVQSVIGTTARIQQKIKKKGNAMIYALLFPPTFMWLLHWICISKQLWVFLENFRELNRKVNWWSFFMRKEHICFHNGMKNWSCFNLLNFALEISLNSTFFCIKWINKWK